MFNNKIIYLILIFAVLISGCNENLSSFEKTGGTPSGPTPLRITDQAQKPNSTDRSDALTGSIIDKVMTREYPSGFDASLGCWKYTLEVDDNQIEYCMTPSKASLVNTTKGRKLYFYAYNRSTIGGSRYAYSHNDAGLMGAFEVTISADGNWLLSSSTKDMEFGSIGDCSCEQARFVRLGEASHGWIFSSGGTWQGETTVFHNIVASRGDRFEDVSRIPMLDESTNSEYGIRIDDSAQEKEMFPLIVTMTHDSAKSKIFTVNFDFEQWAYQIKEDQT